MYLRPATWSRRLSSLADREVTIPTESLVLFRSMSASLRREACRAFSSYNAEGLVSSILLSFHSHQPCPVQALAHFPVDPEPDEQRPPLPIVNFRAHH